jgi:hypothetical protein
MRSSCSERDDLQSIAKSTRTIHGCLVDVLYTLSHGCIPTVTTLTQCAFSVLFGSLQVLHKVIQMSMDEGEPNRLSER